MLSLLRRNRNRLYFSTGFIAQACFLYSLADRQTKAHEPGRCLFHVCLGSQPGLRPDVVNEFSGSTSCYLHLLYDTIQTLKVNQELEQDDQYIQTKNRLVTTLRDSRFYHHFAFRPLFLPQLDESSPIRFLKYQFFRFRLMYDLWVKRSPRIIVPVNTFYKADGLGDGSASQEWYNGIGNSYSSSSSDNLRSPRDSLSNSNNGAQNSTQEEELFLGHRSYMVLERDSSQVLLFDTSQLPTAQQMAAAQNVELSSKDATSPPHSQKRIIAVRFQDLDLNSMDTINTLADLYVNHTVPQNNHQVAHENDNEVLRLVNTMHRNLSHDPSAPVRYEPEFLRKGQLYGTCSYSPYEKMIGLWFPKQQAKILKQEIRQEVYDRYAQQLIQEQQVAENEQYVLRLAKANVL